MSTPGVLMKDSVGVSQYLDFSFISLPISSDSVMTNPIDMFDYIPNTCEDNLSEMTYVLLAAEDGDENNICNETVVNNNHYNQNISEKLKSEDGSGRNVFTRKAKRGRPCAKPPTKETLRRRRKVVCKKNLHLMFV